MRRAQVPLFQLVINLHSAPWRLLAESLVQRPVTTWRWHWTLLLGYFDAYTYSGVDKQKKRSGDAQHPWGKDLLPENSRKCSYWMLNSGFYSSVCYLPNCHSVLRRRRSSVNKSCVHSSVTPPHSNTMHSVCWPPYGHTRLPRHQSTPGVYLSRSPGTWLGLSDGATEILRRGVRSRKDASSLFNAKFGLDHSTRMLIFGDLKNENPVSKLFVWWLSK